MKSSICHFLLAQQFCITLYINLQHMCRCCKIVQPVDLPCSSNLLTQPIQFPQWVANTCVGSDRNNGAMKKNTFITHLPTLLIPVETSKKRLVHSNTCITYNALL